MHLSSLPLMMRGEAMSTDRKKEYQRQYHRDKRANESEQERTERLAYDRLRAKWRLESETPEKRERRLKQMREYQRRKREQSKA